MLERVLKYNGITDDATYLSLYSSEDRDVKITKSYTTYFNNTAKCNNRLSFEVMDRVSKIAISEDDNEKVLAEIRKLISEMRVNLKSPEKSLLTFILEARAHHGVIEDIEGFCRDYKNIDLDRFREKYELDDKYKDAKSFVQIAAIMRNRMPNISSKISSR